MTREIKFRAWDIKYGGWVSRNICIDCDGMRYWILGMNANPVDRDEYDLMQYTGLKDKNGKEIYEGDIVIHRHAGEQSYVQGVVIIESTRGICVGNWPLGFGYEVIGNMHENKDL